MKFKKVEIQAFRAYEEVANGTFDFNISKNGQELTADFVSIFAPNGFGKTSFYDAVEYGLTDSIDRFLKNAKLNKEAAKSERQLNSNQKGQYLLRNKYAPEDLDTEINIYFTDSNLPSIKKKIDKANRKGTVDFHFTESRVQNKYFQSVILSQDWIDAFLKVDDPSVRYDRFMEYFGDKKLDDYYKKIIELINQNDKRILELKNKLLGVQQELDFAGDKNILTKVNDKIIELNTLNETLSPILESYSESDSFYLSNFISERLSDINFQKMKEDELLKFIDHIFSENIDVIGIENYFNSKNKYIQLEKDEKELRSLLDKFGIKSKSLNELNQVSENQKQLIIEKEKVEAFFSIFPYFNQISDDILKLEDQIEIENKKKSSIDIDVLNLKIRESEQKSKLENLNKQITELEGKIQNLPLLNQNFIDNNVKSNDLKNKIDIEELKLKPLLQNKLELELELETLNATIFNIKQKLYPSINEKLFFEFKDLIIEIEKNECDLKEKSKNLEKLNIQIKEQESLNKDIEKFILKGAEIIDKNQDSLCPLCNHEYDSFKELSDRVSNNNLLSALLSSFLKQRSDIENQISSISGLLKGNIETLTNSLNQIIIQKTESLSNFSISISRIEDVKKNINIEFKDITESIQKFNVMLEGMSYEEYINNRNVSLDNVKKELSIIIEPFEKDRSNLKSKISELEIIENRIKTLEKAIQESKDKENYLKITDYYKFQFPNQKIELRLLEQQIADIIKSIEFYTKKAEEIHKNIKDIEESLEKYTQQSIEKELLSIVKIREIFSSNILSFEQDIKSKLEFDSEKFDKESLIKQIIKKRENL